MELLSFGKQSPFILESLVGRYMQAASSCLFPFPVAKVKYICFTTYLSSTRLESRKCKASMPLCPAPQLSLCYQGHTSKCFKLTWSLHVFSHTFRLPPVRHTQAFSMSPLSERCFCLFAFVDVALCELSLSVAVQKH